MLQRGGLIIAKVVADTKAKTLRPHIDRYIQKGSTIYTDEWYYGNLHEHYQHHQVFHAAKIYARGEVHTNTIEGFWGILKRGLIGIYNHVSRKHLQKYVDEFCWRFNTRKLKEGERFFAFLNMMTNRLKHKDLITQ